MLLDRLARDRAIVLPHPVGDEALRPPAGGRVLALGGEAIGTCWRALAVVQSGADDRGGPARLEAIVVAAIDGVAAAMSQWRPDSELSRFNRSPAGTWHELSPDFSRVLGCALALAAASGGAFDPTLGQSTDLWGFGASPAPETRPDNRSVEEARGRWTWRDMRFEPATRRLYQPGGLRLDLCGIAKGFAVDRVVDALRRAGIGRLLFEIGGELRACGTRPDGQPWWVDVEPTPAGERPGSKELPPRIALSGWSVATSGSYHRTRTCGGRSVSHTLCPATGRPLGTTPLAVTVLHPSCMQADALATAIMVLGADAGLRFAEAHRLAVRLVDDGGEVMESARWRRFATP